MLRKQYNDNRIVVLHHTSTSLSWWAPSLRGVSKLGAVKTTRELPPVPFWADFPGYDLSEWNGLGHKLDPTSFHHQFWDSSWNPTGRMIGMAVEELDSMRILKKRFFFPSQNRFPQSHLIAMFYDGNCLDRFEIFTISISAVTVTVVKKASEF